MKRHVILLLLASMTIGVVLAQQKADTTTSRLKRGINLDEVVVRGNRPDFGVKSAQMSAVSITPQQILRVPVFMGEADVLKALQRLPGVQSQSEGTAGIVVRGGDYDQNLVTVDGAPLYNVDHLKGYVSAINPDMVSYVDFYRGAFPARYGSRLSSIVDVGLREGNMQSYHGQLTLGMLSAHAQAEGPIWKDRTSFNIAGRLSYFNLIAKPLLKHYYDKPKHLQPYADIKYFDVNAKLAHRFSQSNTLTASFFYGRDRDNETPTNSAKDDLETDKDAPDIKYAYHNTRNSATRNNWSNMLASLKWNYDLSPNLSLGTTAYYSQYRYLLGNESEIYNSTKDIMGSKSTLTYERNENSKLTHHSDIDDLGLNAELRITRAAGHDIYTGANIATQKFNPTSEVFYDLYAKRLVKPDDPEIEPYYAEYKFFQDTVLGAKARVNQIAVFAQDDWDLTSWLRVNYGARLSLYSVTGKTYTSLEPRLAVRLLMLEQLSLKLSYSRMAQATHRLSNSNLVMPGDIWVPITEDIPLMKSDLMAAGLNYEISEGFNLSLEGYYKKMSGVIEYRQGASYARTTGDWSTMVALGDGRAYGFEFLAEKKLGNTTGWLSYTWSKSLRTFDRAGMELNGGKEFYAANDRRHNLSAIVTHRFNFGKKQHLDLTAAWSLVSGRCGTLPTVDIMGATIREWDPLFELEPYHAPLTPSSTYVVFHNAYDGNPATHFYKATHFYTYKYTNDYRLPTTHHLDLSIAWAIRHRLGESQVTLSVYNVYNQLNPDRVYVGYDKNKIVLKGICPFPIMPSLSYTHKF